MTLASRGGGRVPLDAVVRFIRLARSYNQREVVEILAEPTISLSKVVYSVYLLSSELQLGYVEATAEPKIDAWTFCYILIAHYSIGISHFC